MRKIEFSDKIEIAADELNRRINQSEEDFKNGKFKSTAELLKKYNQQNK